MSRATVGSVVVVLLVSASLLSNPSAPFSVSAPVDAADPGWDAPATLGACGLVYYDGSRSSGYSVLSAGPTSFDLTVLDGSSLEYVGSAQVGTEQAVRVDGSDSFGAHGALVEFTEDAGVVGVAFAGDDFLVGDVCSGAIPASWHLPGGATLEDDELTLRLFNPFTSDARVDLWAFSELGTEAAEAIENLTVPARRTRIVPLHEVLAGRESLSIIVRTLSGSVIPVMLLESGSDTALWPGVGTDDSWEFALAGVSGLQSELVMTNDALVPVDVLVEFFDESGPVGPPVTERMAGPGQARVAIDMGSSAIVGLRVTGDGPFAAAVRGRSPTGLAGTAGSTTTANVWLVPGLGSVGSNAVLSIMNTSTVPRAVSIDYIMAEGTILTRGIEVGPQAVLAVPVERSEIPGLRVVADGAVSVGWFAEASGRFMFSRGVPVE